jgi:hypothetical protein
MKKSELQTMVIRELKALARKMKVKLPTGARKSNIVDMLSLAFAKGAKTEVAGAAVSGKNSGIGIKKSAIVQQSEELKKAAVKKNGGAARQISVKRTPSEKPSVGPTRGEWKLPPGAEEPLLAQERVSDAKYYTGPGQEQKAGSYAELPASYGEEKVGLMVRDPFLAYVYWEVTPSRIEREKAWFGWNCKLTVRIYDVTGVQFDGRNAIGYFDQEVKEVAGNWYFDLGRPTHSFLADIGLRSPDGRYLTLARSNHVVMPRDGVSDVVDEEWMLVDEEFWKLYGFPGGPSSAQLQEMMRLRRMQQITSPGTFSRERSKRK